jgi:hypothetical protein
MTAATASPSLEILNDTESGFEFRLKNVDVSVANALRKSILADIPCVVFDVEAPTCIFHKNNTRFHNEILKERLRCIPVHCTDRLLEWAQQHYVEVEMKNTTNEYKYMTTGDFKLKRKSDNSEVSPQEREAVFPRNVFNRYIDFVRLGPFIHENILPEMLHFRAEFMVSTARVNGCYSMVSKCAYHNTRDVAKATEEWTRREKAARDEWRGGDEKTAEQKIAFLKRDFYCLDAQRFFVPNSFDFVVHSIGVYSNREIVKKACISLQNQCVDLIENIKEKPETVLFYSSETHYYSAMENAFDLFLYGITATIGPALNHRLHTQHLQSPPSRSLLTFCAFKRFHPHDPYSVLRVAFAEKTDMENVKGLIVQTIVDTGTLFEKVYKLFG